MVFYRWGTPWIALCVTYAYIKIHQLAYLLLHLPMTYINAMFTPSNQSRWSQQYWQRSCHDFPNSIPHEGIVHAGATLPCGSSDEPILKRVNVHELWAPVSSWAYTWHMALEDMLSASFLRSAGILAICKFGIDSQWDLNTRNCSGYTACHRLYMPFNPPPIATQSCIHYSWSLIRITLFTASILIVGLRI